jgi:hypothetical protein
MSIKAASNEDRLAVFKSLPEESQQTLRDKWHGEVEQNRKLIKAANAAGNINEAVAIDNANAAVIAFLKETA